MRLRAGLRSLWWYVREVFGETAYDNYLAHCARAHPDGRVLTRREFEQVKTQPNVRCC